MVAKTIISAPDAKPDEALEDYPKTMSRGERLFNWLTYGGIAGVAVFLADIPFTHLFKYGKGAKWWKRSAERLHKAGLSENAVEQILNTTVLGIPGTAVVLPVKLLENHKPQIVEKLNGMLGEKDGAEIVKVEPKQTWWSLIKSRVIAYAVVWGSLQGALTVFGGDRFKKFEEKFSEHVVCKPLGKATHIGARIAENETKAFHYGRIAALNVFATSAAAILLYAGSRIFADRKSKKRDIAPQDDNAPVKNNVETSAIAEDCLPCRLKSYVGSMSPAESFAGTVASEKAKASETPLGIGA